MKHILVSVLLAACGGSKRSEPTTPPTVAATAVVELGNITVFDNDRPFMKLHADGRTEVAPDSDQWGPGPTLHADGTVDFDGKLMGKVTVAADGSLGFAKAARSSAHTIVVTDSKLTVTTDGEVSGLELAADGKATFTGAHHRNGQSIRFEGADTPGKRRTAMLLALVFFGKARVVSGPATEGS